MIDDAAPAPTTAVPRPSFHLTASGWVNDPLGLTHRGDGYHVFYQHVPGSTAWDLGCRWGHATSPDLLRWTEQAVALEPGDGDGGCWSGSVAVPRDGGPAVLFYTSVNLPNLDLGRARVAHPLDDAWTAWAKGDVVAQPPDEPGLTVFRDPCVFRDGEAWRMLVGGAFADGTATALAYRSDDLASWTYEGPFLSRHTSETDGAWTGKGWECPQLLAVDDAHVLVFSVWEPEAIRDVACAVGGYEDGRFTPAAWQQLAFGGHYAASAFHDADGRPGLIFWIRDVGDPGAGWEGALSVPYLLTAADGVARLAPHPALEARRAAPGADGDAALDVEWTPALAPTLTVRAAGDGDGSPVVSLTSGPGWVEAVTAPTGGRPGRTLRVPRDDAPVRVVLDGPVLEVCTGLGVAGAQVVAPAAGVRVDADGAPGVRVWAVAVGPAAS